MEKTIPPVERTSPYLAEESFQPATAVTNFGFTDEELSELSDENKQKIHNYIDNKVNESEPEPKIENQDLSDSVDIEPKADLNSSSDKPFIEKAFSWLGAIHKIDKLATYTAILSNFGGAFAQLFGLPDDAKEKLAKAIDIITNLSFIPYGLDGIRIGAKEKKNPYQAFGFGLELATVWLSDIKMKYLVRGAGTGTDQIWVATDQKLKEEEGIVDGRFKSWADGFIKVPKICLKMLKEIIENPIETMFTLKPKGHNALISSIGDIVATLGFATTGKESIFGPIRDIAGALFDWELLLSSQPMQKVSGILFILESAFDFIARFMPSNNLRLFMNHLSIGSGRAALMCYKNSDPNADKKKNQTLIGHII